ncbi:MAG: alpha/beta fold hydrolase [Longimicrobiales bacterium]|nr:alpha/beta fold hydrolase [Longimicrobiales bacterium]
MAPMTWLELRRFPPFLALLLAMACIPGRDDGKPDRGFDPPAAELVLHTVDSDGHPIAVWEKSPAEPRAVLLLVHGRTWSTVPDFDLQVPGENLSLMDGLVDLGIASYGIDLRGYGETPRDPSGWTTPNQAADDVAVVLAWIRERHATADVNLFGWSQGSRVAQLTAQRHPEALDRLVVFGYPHRPGQRPVQAPGGDPPMEATTAEAAASDFIIPGSISQVAIEAYVESALAADPVRSDWTSGHEFNALDPARVTVPTLILQGEHDPLSPPRFQNWLFTGLATVDKSWVVIPGGDHAAFLETPRAYFLSALESFLLRGEM